jgi:hypothetical protein
MPLFGASLTDNSRVIIYNRNLLIIQATELSKSYTFSLTNMKIQNKERERESKEVSRWMGHTNYRRAYTTLIDQSLNH